MNEKLQAILDYLKKHGGKVELPQMEAELNVSHSTLDYRLKKLIAEELIETTVITPSELTGRGRRKVTIVRLSTVETSRSSTTENVSSTVETQDRMSQVTMYESTMEDDIPSLGWDSTKDEAITEIPLTEPIQTSSSAAPIHSIEETIRNQVFQGIAPLIELVHLNFNKGQHKRLRELLGLPEDAPVGAYTLRSAIRAKILGENFP